MLPFIAPPPLLILLACPCLLRHHLHLPPLVCLLFVPAGCCVASCCTAFATHPLDPQPFLSMRQLVVVARLVALPLQLVLLGHCCLLTHRLHLSLPFASRLPWLVVASLLIAPPLPLILSMHCHLSMRQLVVALPPFVPLSFSGVVVTHPSWLVVVLHLYMLPPPVYRRLHLLSRRCPSSSTLTSCCVAASAFPCTTALHPPGPPLLFIHRLLLLPPTSLSPAFKVDWCIVFLSTFAACKEEYLPPLPPPGEPQHAWRPLVQCRRVVQECQSLALNPPAKWPQWGTWYWWPQLLPPPYSRYILPASYKQTNSLSYQLYLLIVWHSFWRLVFSLVSGICSWESQHIELYTYLKGNLILRPEIPASQFWGVRTLWFVERNMSYLFF